MGRLCQSALVVALGLALVPASGCMPRANLEVLRPADVPMPAHVRSFAIIDRSRAANAGQTVLGTLEGLVTGESILGDNEGRREAINAASSVLAMSPRFDARVPPFDRVAFESNLFDKPMSWQAVEAVCASAGVDAIVSLEAFDSDSFVRQDSRVERSTDSQGREVRETVHSARRETRAVTGWRVYDPKLKTILDDQRSFSASDTWTSEGRTAAAARSGLPPQADTVRIVGGLSGSLYAQRIAPSFILVTRSYYGGGDPNLKTAKQRARVNDWSGAGKIWQQTAQSASTPKIKGKALYNLALSYEIAGELETARTTAQDAAAVFNKGRVRRYVWTLESRIMDQRRLDEQMGQLDLPLAEPELAVPPAGDGGQRVAPAPAPAGDGGKRAAPAPAPAPVPGGDGGTRKLP